MRNEYIKHLTAHYKDKAESTPKPKTDFERTIRNFVLSKIEPTEITPWTRPEEAHIRPWEFIPNTAESIKVSDVIACIHHTSPTDLFNVIIANKRMPKDQQFFNDPNKVVDDMYKLSIMLRDPKAYVTRIEQLTNPTRPKDADSAIAYIKHLKY